MKRTSLRVCLIATEFQGRGAYGGFGVLTHDIAVGLAARGADVFVVTPRKRGQPPIERTGDLTIVTYPSPLYVGLRSALPFAGLYGMIDADIYHSQEPSLGTALAQAGAPGKKHLVTFQDPRDLQDWRVERAHEHLGALALMKYYIRYQWESGRAARRADRRFCQAKCIIDKTRRMYRLPDSPGFLPNPIHMKERVSHKADRPTVCYVGRWDERKRPELFLELAARSPDVKFVMVGACLNNAERDRRLRERCRALENVEAPGWLADRERGDVLDQAWVLVNTSTRECLPVTYLEAGAHGCAILSHCDADDFASRFGFWARKGDLPDFEQGLRSLLTGGRWQDGAEKAYAYVRDTHEYSQVIDRHIQTYEEALGS
jgi:glycosyltransferase involved in cell wall biosynthesis